MTTWTYPSSSGPGEYTTVLGDDGKLECNCRGFLIKRGDKPRTCRHTDDVVKKNALNTVQRGDYIFVTDPTAPALAYVPAPVDHGGNLEAALANGYVNPMLGSAITGCKGPDELWARINSSYLTGYLWEEKWDGQRAIVSVKNHQILDIWSRPRPGEGELGLSRLDKVPPYLQEHVKTLPDGTYDAEQIVLGDRSWAVTDASKKDKQAFVLFDLPRFMGHDFTSTPIEMRRGVLEKVVAALGSPYLVMSQTFTPGRAAVDQIWARGGEGAMIKRVGSLYRPGWRSPDWIKVKLWEYTKVRLTGFDKGKEGPRAVMLFTMPTGVPSRCKVLGNKWLKEFAVNGDKYLDTDFIVKHQGVTEERKPRHPQFDHFAGPGE